MPQRKVRTGKYFNVEVAVEMIDMELGLNSIIQSCPCSGELSSSPVMMNLTSHPQALGLESALHPTEVQGW